MQLFASKAQPAIAALGSMIDRLERDLRALLAYFGESPTGEAKPEDLFGTVVSFAGALIVSVLDVGCMELQVFQPDARFLVVAQRAAEEVEAAEARLQARAKELTQVAPAASYLSPVSRLSVGGSQLSATGGSTSSGRRSVGRGGFDEAMRDLRSGVSTRRRAPKERTVQRPLSRMFLDGSK